MPPTTPRLAARSIKSSCTTPAVVTATRVSWGVTLMRISSCTFAFGERDALEQARRLVQRQAHHPGIAAAQLDDEARRAPLDRVGAGLVVRLAGGEGLPDVRGAQVLELHLRA